jgi:hypothetical protein
MDDLGPRRAGERPYDIVVFGATGFAGRLTAEYLADAAEPPCRWAIAGRSEQKLAAVRADLAAHNPALAELPLVLADVDDPASLRAMAESARVVITTVGPYALYGDALVAACAVSGTDYLDLTGEPEFVARTYLRQHETAVTSGARIVHAAGFDSIPHDLGAYFTVLRLPADVPVSVDGYVRVSGTVSGGTFASLLTAMSRPRAHIAPRCPATRTAPCTPAQDGLDAIRSTAAGPCRSPRSTRTSSPGRRGRSTGTARTSATRTASGRRICTRRPARPPGWSRSPAPPSYHLRAAHCSGDSPLVTARRTKNALRARSP